MKCICEKLYLLWIAPSTIKRVFILIRRRVFSFLELQARMVLLLLPYPAWRGPFFPGWRGPSSFCAMTALWIGTAYTGLGYAALSA